MQMNVLVPWAEILAWSGQVDQMRLVSGPVLLLLLGLEIENITVYIE